MTVTSQTPLAPADSRTLVRHRPVRITSLVPFVVLGMVFGVVLIKSEVVSWYRIQEMFRLQSFHMYGIIGSAVMTAAFSVAALKRFRGRTLGGDTISVPRKELGRGYRYWLGGAIFGAGWAMTGVCPGPIFALIGSGASSFVVVAAAALAGTWAYGHLRPSLPH